MIISFKRVSFSPSLMLKYWAVSCWRVKSFILLAGYYSPVSGGKSFITAWIIFFTQPDNDNRPYNDIRDLITVLINRRPPGPEWELSPCGWRWHHPGPPYSARGTNTSPWGTASPSPASWGRWRSRRTTCSGTTTTRWSTTTNTFLLRPAL